MSAFLTVSLLIVGGVLLLGFLLIQNRLQTAQRCASRRVDQEIEELKQADTKLGQQFMNRLKAGETALADAVAEFKRRRQQLLPTAAIAMEDSSLWDEEELQAHRQSSIRDVLNRARQSYNLRCGLLFLIVLFGAALANAAAYFGYYSRASAIEAMDSPADLFAGSAPGQFLQEQATTKVGVPGSIVSPPEPPAQPEAPRQPQPASVPPPITPPAARDARDMT